MCKKYNATDCNAVKAIAWVESNFRHLINKNDNGSPSFGMMQVKCIAAKDAGLKYSCKQLNDKQVAIRFGIKYLEKKLSNHPTLEEAFASYNAGRVIRCKSYNAGRCYPREFVNHEYVYKVLRRYRYQIYRDLELEMLGVKKLYTN
jgi:soluble lytic murein transglycosylase-like protein